MSVSVRLKQKVCVCERARLCGFVCMSECVCVFFADLPVAGTLVPRLNCGPKAPFLGVGCAMICKV